MNFFKKESVALASTVPSVYTGSNLLQQAAATHWELQIILQRLIDSRILAALRSQFTGMMAQKIISRELNGRNSRIPSSQAARLRSLDRVQSTFWPHLKHHYSCLSSRPKILCSSAESPFSKPWQQQ